MNEPPETPHLPSLRQATRTSPALRVLLVTLGMGCALLAVIALAAALTGGRKSVTVATDAGARVVDTRAQTVRGLLNELGILLGPNDSVSPAPETALRDGDLVRIRSARLVPLTLNGRPFDVLTAAAEPAAILAAAGITLSNGDRIRVDGVLADANALSTWDQPIRQIEVERAVPFSVSIISDGRTQTLQAASAAPTIGDALVDAGIPLYLADQVSVPLFQPLEANTAIHITRAAPISVRVDGVTYALRLRDGTVADALAAAGVTLMGLDFTVPADQTLLQAGQTIDVIRVKEILETHVQPLAYRQYRSLDRTLTPGADRLVQPGHPGEALVTERVRLENDVETARQVIDRVVLSEPVDEIVTHGPECPP